MRERNKNMKETAAAGTSAAQAKAERGQRGAGEKAPKPRILKWIIFILAVAALGVALACVRAWFLMPEEFHIIMGLRTVEQGSDPVSGYLSDLPDDTVGLDKDACAIWQRGVEGDEDWVMLAALPLTDTDTLYTYTEHKQELDAESGAITDVDAPVEAALAEYCRLTLAKHLKEELDSSVAYQVTEFEGGVAVLVGSEGAGLLSELAYYMRSSADADAQATFKTLRGAYLRAWLEGVFTCPL